MPTLLFSPIKFRELTFKNRIVVSPMCQYSAVDGLPNAWHLVHLGSRAVGGAAVVIVEATSVSPEARISIADLGIWNSMQVEKFKEITTFIKAQNAIPAIQIAHAGRKGSFTAPWKSEALLSPASGGWTPLAPSAIRFDEHYAEPKEMSLDEIKIVTDQFCAATKNALAAGFEVLEIHMAHGYLLNEFLSPVSNLRKDAFGGILENRMRFPLDVAKKVRSLWPEKWPVFVRISASDWIEGAWNLEDSIIFCKKLKEIGIDLIDCSSGGSSPNAKIPAGPNYQVPFSNAIRKGADIATGAVGIITEAHQAEAILQNGEADIVLLARELLRDPYWPLHAAKALNEDVDWPKPYQRAKR